MNKIEFGSYIKESRLKKNYTQKQLADLLFIDVSAVSKWERGISFPDITLVPDICRILDISEHELISASSDHEYRRIKKDAKTFNNMKKVTFWILNICYAIALLVCLIVNVAVNHTLSWFFIVATSVLCAYSFCPSFTWLYKKYKSIIFIGTTFLSMFILFLTSSIYTNDYWFIIATLGVLLGYFIVFFPILFRIQKNYLDNDKYKKLSRYFIIIYSTVSYVIINLLLVAINVYRPINLSLGLLITNICFIIPTLFGIMNIFDVTRRYRKPVGIVVGTLFSLFMLTALGTSIYQVSTKEINSYNISESFDSIKFKGNADIMIYESEDSSIKAVAKEYEDVSFDIDVINDTLIIKLDNDLEWYNRMFNMTTPYIKLYLPASTLDSLTIIGNTYDAKIDGNFTFSSSNISTDTGNVTIKNASMGVCVIEADTGDIKIYNSRFVSLDSEIDTGDIILSNTIVDNDFNHEGDTGDVVFKSFDAVNIYVETDTGDVRGTILTSKIFFAKSDTGDEDVPETTTGGICRIKTDTGDIKIRIKE